MMRRAVVGTACALLLALGCAAEEGPPPSNTWDACTWLEPSVVTEQTRWSSTQVIASPTDVDWNGGEPTSAVSFALSQCTFQPNADAGQISGVSVVGRLSGSLDRTPADTAKWLALSYDDGEIDQSPLDCTDAAIGVKGELHLFQSRARNSRVPGCSKSPWKDGEAELFAHMVVFVDEAISSGSTANSAGDYAASTLRALGAAVAKEVAQKLDELGRGSEREPLSTTQPASQDAGAPLDGGALAASEFPIAAARLTCSQAARCCTEADSDAALPAPAVAAPVGQELACKPFVEAAFSRIVPNLAEAVQAGRVGFLADAAQMCLDRYAELSCEQLIERTAEFPCLEQAIVPRVGLGGACAASAECIEGTCVLPAEPRASEPSDASAPGDEVLDAGAQTDSADAPADAAPYPELMLGRCEPALQTGDACQSDSQCGSGTCVETCVTANAGPWCSVLLQGE